MKNINLIILSGIILLGSILRFYKLNDLMRFIGDSGWYFLQAKDIAIDGAMPLVGITASFTWLNQGALWSYMLAPVLLIFNFNPLGGAILSAFLGILTILAVYIFGKKVFSENVGLLAAFLLAVSPTAIVDARLAYHTSPIALLTIIFFYYLYKYSKKHDKSLIVASFVLGLLYNFELSTMVFWMILLLVVFLVRRVNLKIYLYSFIAFLAPLIPMMLHDIQARSGYFQLTAFARFIKLSLEGGSSIFPYAKIVNGFSYYGAEIFLYGFGAFASLLIAASIIYLAFINYNNLKNKKLFFGELILLIWVVFSILGIIAKKDISDAYLPMIYPGIILLLSYVVGKLLNQGRVVRGLAILIIGLVGFINIIYVVGTNYGLSNSTNAITYRMMLETSNDLIELVDGNQYNLDVKGEGDQFEAYDDTYQYLLWWMGNKPSQENENMKFVIIQEDGKIKIYKK